ncbi:Prolactin [Fukomys damarensis]|uniref:Prolactin n=1 Tax=Fukomys damarensis TaxID=885580 RepID=A0A091DZI3_FUKDA|nr:Prolactin [Fukomys damarensis]
MNGQGKGSLVMLLAMWSLLLWQDVAAQSNSTNETGYQISLPDLLDRAITLSHYIHTLSSDLYQEVETLLSQDTDFFAVYTTQCHTASISTPANKEQALKIQETLHSQDIDFFAVYTTQCHTASISTPANKEQALKIQVAPQIRNYGNSPVWTQLPSLQSSDGKESLNTFHHLCRCLRRDTHKAETFLRVLKSQVARHSNY